MGRGIGGMGCGAPGDASVTAPAAKSTAPADRKEMSRKEFERKIGQFGFENADEDDSGKVSKAEWDALFIKLDTNGDGVVDKSEWEAAFGKGSFSRWDGNGTTV